MSQETGNKKVVSRTVAIGLGIVCIVLAAGLVGSLLLYAPLVADLQLQLTEQDGTVASLNSQVSTLEDQVSSLTAQVASLRSSLSQSLSPAEVQNLTAEYAQVISGYEAIISLSESGYLVQGVSLTQLAGGSSLIWNDYLDYAGFVVVQVESNSSTTYGGVLYTLPVSEEIFEYNVTVGTSGSAVLPVLPGITAIGIGNAELVDSVNAIVTAVYYY